MARPAKKNALTAGMYLALAEAIDEASAEGSGIAAVVVTGEGDVFTAGNDLADFLAPSGEFAESPPSVFLRALREATVPLVAAVNGPAVGVGATMLLHCDAVHLSHRARLVFPFVQLGLVPEAASTMLLPARIGHLRAARALLLAEPIQPADAVALGLATGVAEDVVTAAGEDAARFAAMPGDAVRTTKRLLRTPPGPMADRMNAEGAEFARLLGSDAFRQAASAIIGR